MLLNPPNYLLHIFGTFKIKFPSDYAVLEGHLLANRHTTERIIEGTVYKVGDPCPTAADADRSTRERKCRNGAVAEATFSSSNTTYSDTTQIGKYLKDSIFIISTMREIYEATILAHIRLVGLIDEYEDHRKIDAFIDQYRSDILAKSDAGALESWKLVMDETFKKFRDGLMEVYVPVDNEVVKKAYTDICALSGSTTDVVVVNQPTSTRTYRKTKCILGTVFQDQAYFRVRRKNSTPAALSRPLTVELACGYNRDVGSDPTGRKSFLQQPIRRCVTLNPNQDAVDFPVPKFSRFFDAGVGKSPAGKYGTKVRCSISAAFYDVQSSGDDSCAKQRRNIDEFKIIDESMLTAVAEVSAHKTTGYGSGNETFHTRREVEWAGAEIPFQSDKQKHAIASALFYMYAWGWYTGFIQMPLFSIQGLLNANSPIIASRDPLEKSFLDLKKEQLLPLYQLLASVFFDEGDARFSTDHFGFLTPAEAYDKYRDTYNDRRRAYNARALGDFLQKVSAPFLQQ